jgi:hypothetical protein
MGLSYQWGLFARFACQCENRQENFLLPISEGRLECRLKPTDVAFVYHTSQTWLKCSPLRSRHGENFVPSCSGQPVNPPRPAAVVIC